MVAPEALTVAYEEKLGKALSHLEKSLHRVETLGTNVTDLDDQQLEIWESFTARFARVLDLFLTKYVRARVLADDPGFAGTLRDFANQAEKLGILDSASAWMELRELRNIVAHEYTDEEISVFYERLRAQAPRLLSIKRQFLGQ